MSSQKYVKDSSDLLIFPQFCNMGSSNIIQELDDASLRTLRPHNLALRFRHVADQHSWDSIERHLLQRIEQEILPPTVFGMFLSTVNKSSLLDALKQPFSRHVRKAANKHLGKRIRSADWEKTWCTVGGTQGLLSLLANSSVLEVKLLCQVIGRCAGRSGTKGEQRADAIAQLLRAILPASYPTTSFKTSDQRPLNRYYAYLVPACN